MLSLRGSARSSRVKSIRLDSFCAFRLSIVGGVGRCSWDGQEDIVCWKETGLPGRHSSDEALWSSGPVAPVVYFLSTDSIIAVEH